MNTMIHSSHVDASERNQIIVKKSAFRNTLYKILKLLNILKRGNMKWIFTYKINAGIKIYEKLIYDFFQSG